jgi:hypothetical protein
MNGCNAVMNGVAFWWKALIFVPSCYAKTSLQKAIGAIALTGGFALMQTDNKILFET